MASAFLVIFIIFIFSIYLVTEKINQETNEKNRERKLKIENNRPESGGDQEKPKKQSLEEISIYKFIELCEKHEVKKDSMLSIACRINENTSSIMTLSIRLFPRENLLSGIAVAPTNKSGDCWFKDGISLRSLGVPQDEIDEFMIFRGSREIEGTAKSAIISFDQFIFELESKKIPFNMFGYGINASLHWIAVTTKIINYHPQSRILSQLCDELELEPA